MNEKSEGGYLLPQKTTRYIYKDTLWAQMMMVKYSFLHFLSIVFGEIAEGYERMAHRTYMAAHDTEQIDTNEWLRNIAEEDR